MSQKDEPAVSRIAKLPIKSAASSWSSGSSGFSVSAADRRLSSRMNVSAVGVVKIDNNSALNGAGVFGVCAFAAFNRVLAHGAKLTGDQK